MGVNKLLRIALFEGCGIPYDAALRSDELRELEDREMRIYSRFPRRSWDGQHLRVSQFQVAQKFWSAYERLDDYPPITTKVSLSRKTRKERARLRFLGKHLVLTAMKILPKKAVELAEEFRHAADEKKPNLLVELFCCLGEILLDKQEQSRKEAVTSDERNPFSWIDIITNSYDYRGVLPKAYGKLESSEHFPVCLGFAILLVSWARLANADVLLANPIKSLSTIDWGQEGEICEMILKELKGQKPRPLVNPDFEEGLQENVQSAMQLAKSISDFHAAVTIRVAPECWFYLDPYLGNMGFMHNSTWGTTFIHEGLSGIHDYLPGLVIAGNDHGILDRFYREQKEKIARMIELSHTLSVTLEDAPSSRGEMEALLASDHLKGFKALARKCYGSNPVRVIIKAMFGWKSSERVKGGMLDDAWSRYESNIAFRRKCLRRLSGLPLMWSKKQYHQEKSRFERTCNYVPPVIELAIPEFTVALLVLNHLNCWKTRRDHLGEFGLKHSTSQILWHQVITRHGLDYDAGKFSWVIEESTDLIRYLRPFLHDRCEMRFIDEGGEENAEAEGEEKDSATVR